MHCLQRLPPSVGNIPCQNIAVSDIGVYSVKSVDTEQNIYQVRMCSDVNPHLPSCECMDWIRHSLPCKHLLAVILKCPDAGGWDGLPEFYRSFPLFNLDCDIAPPQNNTDMTALSSPEGNQELDMEPDEPDATPLDTVHSSQTAQQPPTPATCVEKLQSQLRQVLSATSACTYAITDKDFLQQTLESATHVLESCSAHIQPSEHKAAFFRSRRLVKRSITATRLRRLLAVRRAKKLHKKVLCRSARCGKFALFATVLF